MLISDKLFDTGKLNALLTGSGIAPMWFLATLAFCEIAFLFIRRLTYKMKSAPRLLTILGLAVMFFVIAYILWRIKAIHSLSAKTMGITNFYLFNAFARFTLSLPILIIGYIISQLNIIKAMGKIWCALTGTAMLAGVCLIVHFTSLGTNFHMFFSNNLLLLMCTALLGSCGVLMLSYAVGEYSKVLNFMGINSLFILMLHYPPFKTIAYANNIVRCFTRNPIIITIAATTLTLLISIAGMWLIKNKFFLTKSTGKAKDIK